MALAPDTGIRLLHGLEACRPGKIVSPPQVNGGAFHLEGRDAQTTALWRAPMEAGQVGEISSTKLLEAKPSVYF